MRQEIYNNMIKTLAVHTAEISRWSTERKRKSVETVSLFDSTLDGQ